MNEFPRWKYALVVLALLVGFIYALPNLYPKQRAVQVSANRGATVDVALKEKVQGILESKKVAFTSIDLTNDRLLVRLADPNQQIAAGDNLRSELGNNYTVALNLASTVPSWLAAIHANGMPFGLDLQGGVHFLMEVDHASVIEKQEAHYVDEVKNIAREKGIRGISANRGAQGVVITARSEADREKISAEISRSFGSEVVLTNGATTGDAFGLNLRISPAKLDEVAKNTISQNMSTLRNRIGDLGEPVIQQQGNSRIVVELPGVQDTAAAKRLLGATASLEYRAVDEAGNALDVANGATPPADAKLYKLRESGAPILLKKKVIASGDDLVGATAILDSQSGTPGVSVRLSSRGGDRMLEFTMQNVGKPMAVVYTERIPEVSIVDGKEVKSSRVKEEVISVANIRGVFSSQFQTTGLDSMQEANDLARLLNAGSLAAPVDIVEERVIGASLGEDNIRKGLVAVLIAVGLVVVFVGLYYKMFGLIADVGLLLNLVLLVAILSICQATLTLPGIAGIVLTLGMAIDANVLICERIREELRNGSSPMAAISGGYNKAWATILDANVTHLLAALGLMAFGSGPIRGFAITLFIGIITSMFTSVTVTHVLVGLIFGGRRLKSLSV
ncbi:protein translocase subunit SecD [Tahibacter amnicola]|uniref:Protein translocase subunit SecD n=1 Tax=Tahibacter amnicola TaxID=2976241 RepID=A0ABY6BB24_9GAMM|nr:protein translocase subunit SecD [Tahibacter amnicola]UXI67264.1 protein translocase subunit SecD [Tahibacter amnicola]